MIVLGLWHVIVPPVKKSCSWACGITVPPVKEGPQWECRARPLGMMMKWYRSTEATSLAQGRVGLCIEDMSGGESSLKTSRAAEVKLMRGDESSQTTSLPDEWNRLLQLMLSW